MTHGKTVNIYIVYEKNLWKYVGSGDPTLGNSLFGAVKLVKNVEIYKCKYSGYGIGFDMKGTFSFPTGEFGKNLIIFEADMGSSLHVDSKKKKIVILGEGPTQGLDDTTLTAERKYSINFTKHNKKFCLSLHHDGANSYLFVNGTEIYKFKAENSEINAIPLLLGSISKGFSEGNMNKTGFSGCVCDFSVDYDAIAVDDILNIHKYLVKKHGII